MSHLRKYYEELPLNAISSIINSAKIITKVDHRHNSKSNDLKPNDKDDKFRPTPLVSFRMEINE